MHSHSQSPGVNCRVTDASNATVCRRQALGGCVNAIKGLLDREIASYQLLWERVEGVWCTLGAYVQVVKKQHEWA